LVEIHDVEGGGVGSDEVGLGGLGVGFGDVVEVGRAKFDASPEEEVEIQHVVLFHFRSAFVPS
jgi:hypothetical protein